MNQMKGSNGVTEYRNGGMKSAGKASRLLLLVLLVTLAPRLYAAQWSKTAEVRYRRDVVVTYRARLDGNVVVIEASHAPGWHTYALDNVERAREKTGKATPATELPTEIGLSGGLKVVGKLLQSEPEDLSKPEIRWYTWGFKDAARFAARVERVEGSEATISINGQACNATSCSWVRDVSISLPLPSRQEFAANSTPVSVDLSDLVEVK